MSFDDLLWAWGLTGHQGIREAREGHCDGAAKLLNVGLDPFLPQGETVSTSLVWPDPRQDEPKTRKNALLSTIRGSGGGELFLVMLALLLWCGELIE